MLSRKQSIKIGDTNILGDNSTDGQQTNALLAQQTNTLQNAEPLHESSGVLWFNKSSARHFLRLCSVASLLSVSANTNRTFSWYPTLMIATFIVDLVTGVVFTLEMAFKIFSRGFLKGSNAFARDRWCQFDATMVLFIWISVLLQVIVDILEYPY